MAKNSKPVSIIGNLIQHEQTGEPGIYIQKNPSSSRSVKIMPPSPVWYGVFETLHNIERLLSTVTGDRSAAREFLIEQMSQPMQFGSSSALWAFKNKVVRQEDMTQDADTVVLLVKHCVLSAEKDMNRIRREVQALENLESIPSAQREKIPKDIQMFVWQRDEGKCQECGGKENLEFDHMIPVVEGGSSTARNIQLLCGDCNRRKGRKI